MDLKSGAAVTVQPADCVDKQSLEQTLSEVLENLAAVSEQVELQEGDLDYE